MRASIYVDSRSRVARLDARVKLAGLGAFFLAAFLMDRALAILPLAGGLAVLIVTSGAMRNVRRLAPLFIVAPIGSFTIWSFFYGGENLVPVFGAVGVTREATAYGAGMALKITSFLEASVLFFSVTRVEEFTRALRSFGLPYRVSFVIALAFRLVPLFLESTATVLDAQRARGLELDRGGPIERLRRVAPVLVPVFMGALRRADLMAIALEARGFGRPGARVAWPSQPLSPADWIAAALTVVVVVAYLGLWQTGWGSLSR